jgi:hypothetical protein
MSIITGSTTINSSNLNNINWPITINPSSGTTITFTGTNITFTKNTNYFIIGGNGSQQITITGSTLNNNLQNLTNININLSGTAKYYPGLVQNGSISAISPENAKDNVRIQYLAITSATNTIDPGAGWFTLPSYGLNLPQPNNLLIQYCTSAGSMNDAFSGGIVGASSTARVFNCTSSSTLNNFGQGGIIGAYSTGIADRCTSNCSPTLKATSIGGIFGFKSGGTAVNCVYEPGATGGQNLQADSGGIYGAYATNANIINCRNTSRCNIAKSNTGGIVGAYASGCTIRGCTNNGLISGQDSGGIIGAFSSGCTITQCRNNGGITTQGCGGICGGKANNVTVNNCVNANNSLNITGPGAGGIIGQNSTSCITNSCSNLNNIFGNGIGGCYGTIAKEFVTNNFTAGGIVLKNSIKSGKVNSGLTASTGTTI